MSRLNYQDDLVKVELQDKEIEAEQQKVRKSLGCFIVTNVIA